MESTPEATSPPEPVDGPTIPIPGRAAAAIIGLLVGGFGIGMTYLAMVGCETANGTSTCGGPGAVLLVAILALMALLGSALLRAWQVADPASTSLLAVGLLAVLVLLALVEVIFTGWVFLVVPVLGAAAYAVAHEVTTRVTDYT